MENELDNYYTIISTNQEIFLQHINSSNSQINLLAINRDNINITKVQNPYIDEDKIIIKILKVKCILGIIHIINKDYILYVKSHETIGKINNENIYTILEVDFFDISIETTEKEEKEIEDIKDGISKLLKLGFYYSFGYNLTNSQQNITKIISSLKNKNNICNKMHRIYATINKKYFFNYNLYKRFINNVTKEPIDYNFITPIICGYVGMFNYMINGIFMQFILITRRSQNFAGTRYNTRGINDDGNVANFCESEHILIVGDNICSFCQLRGSAPIFFDQIGITAKTDITRNKELSVQAFSKHLQEINEDYDLIYFINLLNQKKSIEAPIIEEFEKQIKFRNNDDNIIYKYFDMQNECKKDDYSRIDILIDSISKITDLFRFFAKNINNDKVLYIQEGTTRTNCLDCLDRTNVIETRISWLILEKMLKFVGFDDNNIQNVFNKQESFFGKSKNTFKENFKDLWAENGDIISIQYAGTASTITTVTKTGGHNLKGIITHGIATVTRFYQGNFEDKFKQECIDIFLQKDIPKNKIIKYTMSINEELTLRKKEYTKYKDLFIFIGSYNVSGKKVDDSSELENWLTSYKEILINNRDNDLNNIFPDLYIIGFEELDNNKNIKNIITNILLENYTPQNQDTYQLMEEIDNYGLYLLIFVKASIIKYIKNLDSKINKPNKIAKHKNSSILVRFNINNSTICLSCSKLSSSKYNKDNTKDKIVDILNSSFKKYPSLLFKNYDFYFLFGDLNIKVNKYISEEMKNDLIKNHAVETDKDYEVFLNFDEFYNDLVKNEDIWQIDEATIRFSPTYKYIIGEYAYNKKEIPSWTDRIFFKKDSDIVPLDYNKTLLNKSEHQPIYGIYKIKTEILNEEKQDLVLNKIFIEKDRNKNK